MRTNRFVSTLSNEELRRLTTLRQLRENITFVNHDLSQLLSRYASCSPCVKAAQERRRKAYDAFYLAKHGADWKARLTDAADLWAEGRLSIEEIEAEFGFYPESIMERAEELHPELSL